MIKIFFFLIISSILLINRKIHKDILHPVFICGSIWFVFTIMYELLCLTSDHYYKLSSRYYSYVLVYFLSFVLFAVLSIGHFTKKNKLSIFSRDDHLVFSNNIIYICIVCNALLILRICLLSHSFNIAVVINSFRTITTEKPYLITPDIKILLYIFNLTPPLCCYIFISNVKLKKSHLLILLFELLLITILYVSKARIMKYFIMFFVVLYIKKKINLRSFILIISGLIGILFFMTMSRDSSFFDNHTILDYIFVYLLSPIPSFDMLVNESFPYESTPFGGRTLGLFYKLLSIVGGVGMPKYDKMFVAIPAKKGFVPNNVFTCLGNYYMDYGVWGLFLYGVIIGLSFGLLYRSFRYSKKKEFKIAYMMLLFALIFQFFGDFFFQFLILIIQDIICAIIIARGIKVGGSHDRYFVSNIQWC